MLIFENQPDPISYYESLGHKFITKGEWRTTDCTFHGGSDSFRIHVKSGAFKCMSVEFNRKLIKKGPNVQLKIDHVLNPTCLVIRQEAQGDHNGHDWQGQKA